MGAGAKQVGHYVNRGLNLAKFLSYSYCKCYLSVKQSIQFANSDKYYCIVCEWFAPRRTQLLTNYLWLSKFLLFALASDPPASILTNRTLISITDAADCVGIHVSSLSTFLDNSLVPCLLIPLLPMGLIILLHHLTPFFP